MAEEVNYVINVQDLASSKIQALEGHTQHLEKSLGGVHNALSGLKSMAIQAFAAFEVYDFIKESIVDFNKFAQANAQLAASLKSTAGAAGLTAEELNKQSEDLSNSTLFDDKAITKTQSILLTFTQIRGAIYNDAMPAILDLSSKMGEDLTSATVQVGKALNDPIRGMTALRRVGVAFSEDQQRVIKSLVQTGHTAEAQRVILKELNTEFGGSAEANAAVGTGPFVILGHMVENIKKNLGSAIVEIAKTLLPILRTGLNFLSDVFKYINENVHYVTEAINNVFDKIGLKLGNISEKDLFKSMIDGAKKLFEFLKPIRDAQMAVLETIWNGLKRIWAALSQFQINWKAVFTWLRDAYVVIENIINKVIDYTSKVMAVIIDVVHTLWVLLDKLKIIWLIQKAFEVVWWLLKQIWNAIVWVWDHILKPIFDKIEKWYEKLKSWLGIKATADIVTNETVKTTMDAIAGDPKKPGPTGKGPNVPLDGASLANTSSKVTGSKTTTFNIKIDSLVKEFKIETMSIGKNTMDQIRDKVTEVLMAAVNDSQLVLAD